MRVLSRGVITSMVSDRTFPGRWYWKIVAIELFTHVKLFQVNYLSHLLLVGQLFPLSNTQRSRVVTASRMSFNACEWGQSPPFACVEEDSPLSRI